jgi:chromosome partitioning protein
MCTVKNVKNKSSYGKKNIMDNTDIIYNIGITYNIENMSVIIPFMNQKGGVGKTTICTLTASALHSRTSFRILVIDADNQHSIHKLREAEGDKTFDIIPFYWKKEGDWDIPLNRFRDLIEEKEEEYDIILIDSPGKLDGQEIPMILTVADFVIVPLVGSFDDIQSTIDYLKIVPPIAKIKEKKGFPLSVYGLVNMKDRTLEYEQLEELEGVHGLEIFTANISRKARYKRKSTIKDIITAKDPADEFNQYFNEFLIKCKLQ